MNRERLLKRFLEYVQVDTTARENVEHYPSSDGQLELGRLAVSHLKAMGASDVTQDEFGIVMATIPGNTDAPTIAFNAHFDTSPETTGANVKPQVIENYSGGDISLPGDGSRVITVEQCPELKEMVGKTLITTDGTTLLGGDDKAGMAIMMEMAQYLLEHPDIPRGPVRLLLTCDEEIGRGADHVDVNKVDAVACYTFDGGGQDMVDVETFSADLAVVNFTGINIHPSIAKDKMVNAIRAAGRFIEKLPHACAPEKTEGREGFMHPYTLEGGVANVTLKVLLRSFDTPELGVYAKQLQEIAHQVENEEAGISIDVTVMNQYRNMADGLKKEPRAADYAIEAHRRLGREAVVEIIRGGTDGARFTELGLPTPNLSSGQHNIHSPLEFACLDQMLAACEIGVELVKRWAESD